MPDCPEIRARNQLPPEPHIPPGHYPIAFAFIVYTDYMQLERLFAFYLRSTNHFCFALDKSSPPIFRARVKRLAACFPDNVHNPDEEYATSSEGKSLQLHAYFGCMQKLVGHKWEYLMLLEVSHSHSGGSAEIATDGHSE